MQMNTGGIRNKQHTRSHVGVWMHCDRQKKCN